jgi:nucleoside-diphosphate-sugar epimerase
VIISLLEKAAKVFRTEEPLEVWGDGTASRDFLSTKTASTLITDLVDKQIGVVNIGSGQEILIKEIANEIVKVFELSGGVKFVGINQGITGRTCSVEKLEKFSPSVKEINSKKDLWREIKAFKENKLPN